MTHEPSSTPASRVSTFFEQLSPQALEGLAALYEPEARFKDPFNEVQGLAAIRQIFEHMYVTLHAPRFVVTSQVVQGDQCFLAWEFHFQFRRFKPGQDQLVRGGTHLVFSPQGRVLLHRDYWDAAEELYEKLPWVGGLMRWLKKRANS